MHPAGTQSASENERVRCLVRGQPPRTSLLPVTSPLLAPRPPSGALGDSGGLSFSSGALLPPGRGGRSSLTGCVCPPLCGARPLGHRWPAPQV